MKLIVLQGPENSGKTTTLKKIYERLKCINAADSNYFEYVDSNLRDFNGVLEIDTNKICGVSCNKIVKVGIITQGDYVRKSNSIYNHLKKMLNEKCDITICACSEKKNSSINPIDKINSFVTDNKQKVDNPIIIHQRIVKYTVQDILIELLKLI